MIKPATTVSAAQTVPGAEVQLLPSDFLLSLISSMLAPMFIGVSGGDIGFARTAAVQTVNAYRARDQADLIAVAQIVAFGLTAISSLSLSMTDGISMSLALRLRGNANALDRSAQQNRRALKQSQPGKDNADASGASAKCTQAEAAHCGLIAAIRPDPVQAVRAESGFDEQKVEAAISQSPAAVTKPAPLSPPSLASPPTEQQRQRLWAAAMNEVANKYSAGLPQLPPEERKAASNRAAALRSCATDLLASLSAPPVHPVTKKPQEPGPKRQ